MLFQKAFISLHLEYKMRQIIAVCFRLYKCLTTFTKKYI